MAGMKGTAGIESRYEQELHRALGVLGNIAITISAVTPASSVFIIIPFIILTAGTGAFLALVFAALIGGGEGTSEDLDRMVRRASVAARADYIVTSMPTPLRAALELAYFQRRDYRQTAAELGVSEDEARRRLRLGLQLLATAHDEGPAGPAPGYGRAP